MGTYPDVIAYFHGFRRHIRTAQRVRKVIESGYDNLMSYKHVVAYLQAALVLKTACRIYENVFADSYVFAAIGIKRRKKPERAVDFTARQL